jgi:hypothetical protein
MTPIRALDSFTYTGARALSMGKAFTALADDESAMFYNAAGLAYLEGQRAGISGVYMGYEWEATIIDHIMTAKYGERGFSLFYLRKSIAVSFSLMGEGWWDEITFRRSIYDPEDTYTMKPVFYERYFTVSYAREAVEGLSFGATVKYLNTDDPYDVFVTKNGFTIDVGVLYRAMGNLSIGLGIANIVFSETDYVVPDDFGQNAYLDELPRNLALGIAYRPHPDIVVTADAHNLIEDEVEDVLYEAAYTPKQSYHIGCEWRAAKGLFLRAGYFYDQRISDFPDLFARSYEYASYHNVTFGAGIVHMDLGIDAGIHYDDRKSKMEEHTIELNNTTLKGLVTVSLSF